MWKSEAALYHVETGMEGTIVQEPYFKGFYHICGGSPRTTLDRIILFGEPRDYKLDFNANPTSGPNPTGF